MSSIKVLTVDDSSTIRTYLAGIIAQDSRLEHVGIVGTAEEALKKIPSCKPDIITMDIRLPGMNGFEATKEIMRKFPVPIVVVSASIEEEQLQITMNALNAGALAIIKKPLNKSAEDMAKKGKYICDQLVLMSQVKVIRRKDKASNNSRRSSEAETTEKLPNNETASDFKALGIVASTGGPQAISTVLEGLPEELSLPVFIVQHMPDAFIDGFVTWLDQLTKFRVKKAERGELVESGIVYVAPGGTHMGITNKRIVLQGEDKFDGHRPSGTKLFEAMAEEFQEQTLGVLLTGMGGDGASGLLAIRKNNGYTIAESEKTAVVYGMPKIAVELGAVCESLPLDKISQRLTQIMRSKRGEEVG